MDKDESDTYKMKKEELKMNLPVEYREADLKISLLNSSARSLNWNSNIKPFPQDFVNQDEKDIDALVQTLSKIPNLKEIEIENLDEPTINLLHWIIQSKSTPNLKCMQKVQFDEILNKCPCNLKFTRPNFIFQVTYPDQSPKVKNFEMNAKDFKTRFAYHGSKMINFHSILLYGLQQHLNKTSLYGEGIYLSEEIHVSLVFSPTCRNWEKSNIGSHLSCIAMCEYIDNPNFVICKEENPAKRKKTDFPEKYILIKNNDMVIIRYLLIYSQNSTAPKNDQRKCFSAWLYKHKWAVLFCGYIFLLLFISFLNSRTGHFVMTKILNTIKI